MQPVHYFLDHAGATVDLTLVEGRFVTRTQGKGALDKPKVIDITASSVDKFCLVPTIGAQNLQTFGAAGDHSYDAELIFSYRAGDKLLKKRVFVNSNDASLKMLLDGLGALSPSASLLHLDPADAQKQIGAVSASKVVYILIGLLVGIPILIAIIFLITKIVGR